MQEFKIGKTEYVACDNWMPDRDCLEPSCPAEFSVRCVRLNRPQTGWICNERCCGIKCVIETKRNTKADKPCICLLDKNSNKHDWIPFFGEVDESAD